MKDVRIWDIPTRLFHWSLVLLLCVSFYTGLSGGFVEMDYHMLSGYCILTLVLFRVTWGFLGSHHSRFTTFIKGPTSVLQHTKDLLKRGTHYPGHNPLGALSIIAILTALLIQASTGLFANDDIMLEGPLSHLVSYDTSRWLTGIHKTNIWVIGSLAGLHVIAILFYQFYRQDPLIGAMFTGRKALDNEPGEDKEGEKGHSLLKELLTATVILSTSGAVVYAMITYL
jgi:cytochrome b